MIKYNIVIDLGCTNTRILKSGVGVVLNEPTLLLLDPSCKKNSVKAVGNEALSMSKRSTDFQLVCPLKNGIISNKEYAKILVSNFLEKLNEKKFFRGNLLWLVPTGLAPNDRNEYINLGYALGYKNVDVLPRVLSACQELEIDVNDKYARLIVDLGGDSTNISVIYRGRVVQGSTLSLGGRDLDNAIKKYLEEVFNMDIDMEYAKNLKQCVNSVLPNDQIGCDIVIESDEGNNTLTITALELREIYLNFFIKVCDNISKVVKMCTSDIIGELGKTGIYLIGGLANITGLDKFIKTRVGMPVYVPERPEYVSIFGAEKLVNEPEKLNRIISLN